MCSFEKELKFIVSGELGRLAKWLRILGYDASYFDSIRRGELIIQSLREGRMILTRDSRLKDHRGLKIVHIKSDLVKDQLKQTIDELELRVREQDLFTRCVICNRPLEDIDKKDVGQKVPPYVFRTQEHFRECTICGRIYWAGTHWNNVKKFIASLRALKK